MKIRDIPVLFILLFSFIASFAMGCSGGGSNTPGGGTGTPSGNAPGALASGNILVITGGYTRLNSGVPFSGTTVKTITFTSPTSATYNVTYIGETNSGSASSSGDVTYTVVGPNLAKVTLTNFPYFTNDDASVVGVIEIQMTFSSAAGGSYNESGITVVTPYSGAGSFTFSSGVVIP